MDNVPGRPCCIMPSRRLDLSEKLCRRRQAKEGSYCYSSRLKFSTFCSKHSSIALFNTLTNKLCGKYPTLPCNFKIIFFFFAVPMSYRSGHRTFFFFHFILNSHCHNVYLVCLIFNDVAI